MKKLFFILFAGATIATVAFSQENNNPPTKQKQDQAASQSPGDKCCGKDCCKHMKAAKKDKASKKDNSETAMACCK
jgi:hypothetical protein